MNEVATEPRTQRLRLLVVSPDDVQRVLDGSLRFANLPAGARVLRWATPYELNAIALVIEHPSFEPVGWSQEIPSMVAEVHGNAPFLERLERAERVCRAFALTPFDDKSHAISVPDAGELMTALEAWKEAVR